MGRVSDPAELRADRLHEPSDVGAEDRATIQEQAFWCGLVGKVCVKLLGYSYGGRIESAVGTYNVQAAMIDQKSPGEAAG